MMSKLVFKAEHSFTPAPSDVTRGGHEPKYSEAVVFIRRNSDGEVRAHRDARGVRDGLFNRYIWADGNYRCDCNRAVFFASAGADQEPEHIECGETEFTVIRAANDAGATIWDGDEAELTQKDPPPL